MAEATNGQRASDFGATLAKARQRADLTQAVLAERAGIKPSTLSSWERGEFEPPPDAVFEIERALKIAPGRLSRVLGYLPVRKVRCNVEEAVASDPRLDAFRRRLLLSIYDTLVDNDH